MHDSEDQLGDPFNPVWHNHVVALAFGDDITHPCGINTGGPYTEVADLSFESPGEVKIKKNKAEIKKAEYGSFNGVLFGTPLTLNEPVNTVVSFTLNPVNDLGDTDLAFTHVCVENATFFSDDTPTTKIKGEL